MERGFIVHGYGDRRRNRVLFAGRLEDGRSFAAAVSVSGPRILVPERDAGRLRGISGFPPHSVEKSGLTPFDGDGVLVSLRFDDLNQRARAAEVIRSAHIRSPDVDYKPADALLLELGIRGSIEIEGEYRPGRGVDIVYPDPVIRPAEASFRAPLILASIDIETDESTRAIRAVSLATAGGAESRGIVRVLSSSSQRAPKHASAPTEDAPDVRFHSSEADLLNAFARDLREADPDVITGWNVLDFDMPRLAERFGALDIPFSIGRSSEAARFLPGEGRRSASVFVSGRQVVDALRAVRAGPTKYPDNTLETVSRAVLGEGKIVSASGTEKVAELDELYARDPFTFGAYCLRDAELVLRILDKTGLFRLAVERAALTGVSIDKAWTSVASFERVYAAGLHARGVAGAPVPEGRRVSGAAGGTVLDPVGGIFCDVAVFDFRSLYPTIIRTFNVDPYMYERALREGAPGRMDGDAGPQDFIVAPNGAAFAREPGVLPALIAEYFAARRAAIDEGDKNAAYVYKILMNSFYGVLGTPTCRYARTELAGAITSFAKKWLRFSRDRFVERGLRVLYGDTDSLFVEMSPYFADKIESEPTAQDFEAAGRVLAAEVNEALAKAIAAEYDLESHLELRFEKAYRRFLIPPLRSLSAANSTPGAFLGDEPSDGASRGRAKGYAGLELREDGSDAVEVKGMEAVRSDSTPLARRLQLELLDNVFHGAGEESMLAFLRKEERRLESGELDEELVYKRRLVRAPESYTASTPPQVKVARALGWVRKKGVVEYVWTMNGAEPVSAPTAALNYTHYIETQLLPFAESLFQAAQWDSVRLRSTVLGSRGGQMELDM